MGRLRKRSRLRGLVLVLATGLLSMAGPALRAAPALRAIPASPPKTMPARRASSPTHSNRTQALKYLRAGVALYNAGEYVKAIALYRKAHALYPNPKIYANIGSCYKYMGRPLAAIRYYEKLLAETEMDSTDATLVRLRRLCRIEIKALSKRIARLRIVVPISGALVKVTGREPMRSPVNALLRYEPGRVGVLVTKKGYYPHERTVKLKANRTTVVKVLLLRKIQPRIIIKIKPTTPIYKQWWFWTVLGVLVTGGATATGILLGSRTVDKTLSGDLRLNPSTFGVRY